MRTRPGDYGWAAFAVVVAAGAVWLLLRGLLGVFAARSFPALVLFFVTAGLICAVGWWLGMGAWRRTRWGAPPGGMREYRELRDELRADLESEIDDDQGLP